MICKECQKEFNDNNFGKHVCVHSMTIQEYILKWNYNNIIPLCGCGCGNKTAWRSVIRDYSKFLKGHNALNRVKSEEEKKKIGEKNSINMKNYLKNNPEIMKQKVDAMNNSRKTSENK